MAHVADHLSVSALEQQCRACKDATVSFAPRWGERLLARYNAHGPQVLGDLRRQNGASPSVLKPDLPNKLEERLREPPADGGRWTSAKVAAWMAAELGLARLAPQRGWEALKALGWSVQTPRPRHPRTATAEDRDGFGKKLERQ